MNIKQVYAAEASRVGRTVEWPSRARHNRRKKHGRGGGGGGTDWAGYWNESFSDNDEGGDAYWTMNLAQSPINTSLIKTTCRLGKSIKIRTSLNKGQTWGAFSTVLTTADDILVVSSGYSSDGRLHILYSHGDYVTTCYLHYIYSDDDGANWSAPLDISDIIQTVGYPIMWCFNAIIENGGVPMCCAYRMDSLTPTISDIMVLRLVAGTWTAVSISTDFREEEPSIISLGGNNLLVLARWETSPHGRYMQYFSDDNGLTWIKHGRVDFQLAPSTEAKQAVLKKFIDKPGADEIIVAYFPQMYASDRPLYACYARPADLITYGTLGWNMGNVKTVLNYPTVTVYYGDVCHYNNDYKAIGSYITFDDTLHHTGIITFNIGTDDHDTRAALWQVSTFTTADAELWTLFKDNPGCLHWTDYRDKTKIIKNYATNIISRFDCRIGTGNDFTSGAALLTATGIHYDGITQYLRTAAIAALDQPQFIYYVFKAEEWLSPNRFIDGLTANQCCLLQYQPAGDATPEFRAYLGNSKFTGKSGELAIGTYGIIRFAANGASSFIQVNNGAQKIQDNGAGSMGGINEGGDIAGSYPMLMERKELIVLNYIPDAAEQAYTMTRLATKNGVVL